MFHDQINPKFNFIDLVKLWMNGLGPTPPWQAELSFGPQKKILDPHMCSNISKQTYSGSAHMLRYQNKLQTKIE